MKKNKKKIGKYLFVRRKILIETCTYILVTNDSINIKKIDNDTNSISNKQYHV